MDGSEGMLRRSGRKRFKPSQFDVGDNEAELMKATKLSLGLYRRVVHFVPDVPCFSPTEEEFRNFLGYIDTLKSIGEQCGIVKIKVPEGWWKWNNVNVRRKIITKQQRLHCLMEAKPFGEGGKYTQHEYREQAEQFEKTFFEQHQYIQHEIQKAREDQQLSLEEARIKVIENEYWKIVERVCDEKVTIDYANDLGVNRYGSGFENCEDFSTNWNLTNLVDQNRSILKTLGEKCSGVTIPWLYFGMLFATFCWHTEDHYLYSINYMHTGAPKTWYGVPKTDGLKFERVIKETIPSQFAKNPDLLHHITAMVSPSYLIERGIKVVRCVQKPGELVVTFPAAYHGGFSHGWNCAEAVNFAIPDWIPSGQEAIQRYRSGLSKRASVFSHDRVVFSLCQNALQGLSLVDLSREEDRKIIAGEMKKIYEQEIRLRDWLQGEENVPWIKLVSNQRRVAAPQLCDVCQTEPFLSHTKCCCSPDVIKCLEHTFEGCECDADAPSRTMYVRIDKAELDGVVKKLDYFVDGSVDTQGKIKFKKKRKRSQLQRAESAQEAEFKVVAPKMETGEKKEYALHDNNKVVFKEKINQENDNLIDGIKKSKLVQEEKIKQENNQDRYKPIRDFVES